MELGHFPNVTLSSPDLARMVYFFRGIADPDAIGKSVFTDNYSLILVIIRRRNRSSHLEARATKRMPAVLNLVRRY
jgi:hypothetical protein